MKKTLQKTVRINLGLFILTLLSLTSSSIFAAAPALSGAYISGQPNNSTRASYSFSLNTGLKQTSVVILYSTNSNLSGAQQTSMNISPSNTLTSLNGEIANLSPGATYYYRFTATNPDGVAYSPSVSGTGNFRTSSPAPIFTGETVTNIANTSATYSFSINPSGALANLWLQYATSSNFSTGLVEKALSGVSGSTVSSMSENLTNLTPGTTYFVRVKAFNGAEAFSAGTTFKTLGVAPIPAPVITGLTATNITDNSAKIDFTVNPNNASTSLEIQYATSTDFLTGRLTKVLSAVSGAANVAQSANLTGLAQNTTYYVRIMANNGTSVFSTTATFSTLISVVVPVVNNISASNITQNSAIINFSVHPGNGTTQLSVEYTTNSTFLSGVQTINLAAVSGNASVAKSQQLTALSPNTKYYYRINATNSKGSYLSANSTNFTTVQLSGIAPLISNINISQIKEKTASVNFTLDAQNNGTVSYNIYYSTNPSFGTGNGIVGGMTTTKTSTGETISEAIAGLTAETVFYYKIVAISGTNGAQRTESTVNNFTTAPAPAVATPPSPIAEFKFDNSLLSESNNTTFSSNTSMSFIADRNNIASSALRLNTTSATAPIPNLPIGASSRSVSLWVKIPNASSDNHIFFYGTLSALKSYGLSVQGKNLVNFGYGADLYAVSYGIDESSNWVHVVTTFDGTTANIYHNGELAVAADKSTWNTTLSDFKLGAFFDLTVDDLQIFDEKLSPEQVMYLFQANSQTSVKALTINDANIKLYPNPVHDILNVETPLDICSVDIYNMQGQKVISSNQKQVNVAGLAAGVYAVKIKDVENKVATRKISVK